MEIRLHHEQIEKFKRLHLRKALVLMLVSIVIPLALGFPIMAGSIFFVDVFVAIIIISWKMRTCKCPECSQTLKIPMGIHRNRSGGIWEYECGRCDILWTVDLNPRVDV